MRRNSDEEFDFIKEVTDTLFKHDVVAFIQQSQNQDLILDKQKTQRFFMTAKKDIEALIKKSEAFVK